MIGCEEVHKEVASIVCIIIAGIFNILNMC